MASVALTNPVNPLDLFTQFFGSGTDVGTPNQTAVSNMYQGTKQAMQQNIGTQTAVSQNQIRQQNLASGTSGPVATEMLDRSGRLSNEAGSNILGQLSDKERADMYSAFQSDTQLQLQQAAARRSALMSGVQGAFGLLGGITNWATGLAAAGLAKNTGGGVKTPSTSTTNGVAPSAAEGLDAGYGAGPYGIPPADRN